MTHSDFYEAVAVAEEIESYVAGLPFAVSQEPIARIPDICLRLAETIQHLRESAAATDEWAIYESLTGSIERVNRILTYLVSTFPEAVADDTSGDSEAQE